MNSGRNHRQRERRAVSIEGLYCGTAGDCDGIWIRDSGIYGRAGRKYERWLRLVHEMCMEAHWICSLWCQDCQHMWEVVDKTDKVSGVWIS